MTIWIALAWTAVLFVVIGSMAIRLRATWAGLALFGALLALLTSGFIGRLIVSLFDKLK